MLVLDYRVVADRAERLEIAAAVEVRDAVGAARSIVDGRRRIRTERTGTGRNRTTLCQDRVRRLAVLDPVHERAEQVLRLRSNAAATVPNARGPE